MSKRFGKEGVTKVLETFLDSEVFLSEFVKSLKNQQARMAAEQKAEEAKQKALAAQRVMLPIIPSKYKS